MWLQCRPKPLWWLVRHGSNLRAVSQGLYSLGASRSGHGVCRGATIICCMTTSLRSTLDFLLYAWLQSESLTERERFADHSRETFDAVLDTSERIAREK